MYPSIPLLLRALSDLVAPRHCVSCGRRLDMNEDHLCLHCSTDIPFTHFSERLHNPMADKVNARIREYIPHGVPEDYCPAAALFFYDAESDFKHIPWQLKYEGDINLGRHFGKMLGEGLASSPDFDGVDTVIPVPLHPLRRFRRGYNQAEVIAAEVAHALGVKMDTRALCRTRYSGSQIGMSMSRKASNVSGAFSAHGPIDGRRVLIVDDTFTTGSTLASCYEAIRPCLHPSARISFATLAYVGH